MIDPLSSRLREKYVELICSSNPKGLLSRLMVYQLPLDETLKIATHHNITDAVAYLEFKIGRTQNAMELIKKVR